MKKTHIIFLVCSSLLVVGCKQYLDVKPQGRVIPETDEEFEAALNFRLNQIETESEDKVLGGATQILAMEYITDNLDANINLNPNSSLPLYVGSEINSRAFSYYESLYAVIRDCNIILENMEGRASKLAQEMSAACYALKGACYYNLLRLYCEPYNPQKASEQLGLSLVDKFEIEVYPPRSNLFRSGEYVISLFKRALSYEYNNPKYLFTPNVIKAFMAKTYFWIQDWENALLLSEELIEQYPLADQEAYTRMMTDATGTNNEVIIRSFTSGNTNDPYYSYANQRAKTRPVNKTLIDLFGPVPTADIRYLGSFKTQRINTKLLKGSIRSSEISLMIAECYVHLNEPGKALAELNRLRSKRISGVVDYTDETLPEVDPDKLISSDATGKPLSKLLSAIFDERRKELYMEADRWYELKRNGRPEFWVITNARKYTTKKYLYTFPIKRIDVDKGGLIQNEGYVY